MMLALYFVVFSEKSHSIVMPSLLREVLCTCQSVCPSVTFLFPINNSRTLPGLPSSNFVHPSVLAAEEAYWFWGQRSRSPGSNVLKLFPINNSRTPWPTYLKLGPQSILGSRETLLILGWLGQRSRSPGSNLPKLLKYQLWKWISSSYICATYFELNNPVVQNICDKKHFRGHDVLQTFLVFILDQSIFYMSLKPSVS